MFDRVVFDSIKQLVTAFFLTAAEITSGQSNVANKNTSGWKSTTLQKNCRQRINDTV